MMAGQALLNAPRYFGIVISGFFVFGSGSSAWLIIQGLMSDQADDENYFIRKLVLHAVIMLASVVALVWLAMALKRKQNTNLPENERPSSS